ncbi:hypothetical protein Bca4012_019164 [Brassica carinata]
MLFLLRFRSYLLRESDETRNPSHDRARNLSDILDSVVLIVECDALRHGDMSCLAMVLVRNSGQRLHIMFKATKRRALRMIFFGGPRIEDVFDGECFSRNCYYIIKRLFCAYDRLRSCAIGDSSSCVEEEEDDEMEVDYHCPFGTDDYDLVELCHHIDEDHQLGANNEVCPVCSRRVKMHMVDHITTQHRDRLYKDESYSAPSLGTKKYSHCLVVFLTHYYHLSTTAFTKPAQACTS